jgi:hypothetical protein
MASAARNRSTCAGSIGTRYDGDRAHSGAVMPRLSAACAVCEDHEAVADKHIGGYVQSSSQTRVAAGAFGFLIFSQVSDRPER